MTDDQTDNNDKPSRSARIWAKVVPGVMTEPRNRHDMVDVVRDAARQGAIDSEAAVMLEGVLDVADIRVRDIMVPRSQMVVLQLGTDQGETLQQIVESGHSRFPVIDEDRDDIDGVLLAKDVLREVATSGQAFDLKDLLRPVVFVPESKRLNVLLKEFRENRNHMAVVVDEYGGVSGLVTIEDVIEQIVGEIDDEHDIEEEGEDIVELDQGRYVVNALTELDAFNSYFDMQLIGDDVDTIGGLIMQRMGRMPRRGDMVKLAAMRFKVTKADGRRVHKLLVQKS